MPKFYPIPEDGPVGQMLRATKRHPNRPAHVHFMISAPGYETLITHVFAKDSSYLDSDAVFGVKEALIREFTREAPGSERRAEAGSTAPGAGSDTTSGKSRCRKRW